MERRVPPAYLVPDFSAKAILDLETVEVGNRPFLRLHTCDLARQHINIIPSPERLKRLLWKSQPFPSARIHWMRRRHDTRQQFAGQAP